MSQRKKILWLVSWYPNLNDAYDGDFIQRHARAAAIFHDIHVVFVTDREQAEAMKEEKRQATGLTEQVIYFRKPAGLLSALRKQWLWRRHFKTAVQQYVKEFGKPDLVHVHVPWKAGLMALELKEQYRIPFIISEHWGMYDKAVSDHFGTRPVYVQKLMKQIYRQASRVTTVSRYLSAGILQTLGREADLIVPNVVDTTLFYHRPEKYSRFTFLHISNMVPIKNAGAIIEAFARLQKKEDVQLIMIGNRDEVYVQKAASMGLLNQSVFFRGEISYTEVAEEMRRSHGLVLFSDRETFSCVTAEALCAGLPVVATRAGALPELVSAENGILVETGDVDALAQAMETIHGHYKSYDPAAISREATALYGYDAVSRAFDRLYQFGDRLDTVRAGE